MRWSEKYGLMRSWLMYYAKPFNRRRLNRFYRQFIQPGDLVFDIGAHLGNRSQAFLDLGAWVVAAEPQPLCVQYMVERFGHLDRFELLPYAIGREEGRIDFRISRKSPTISTARDTDWQKHINHYSRIKATWDESIAVRQHTLDQLIEWHGLPRFCKIDAEGFEWEIIQGLNQGIPALSIEFLAFDAARIICCIDKLRKLENYRLNFSPGESQRWLWKTWQDPEAVIDLLMHERLPRRFGDLYFRADG